MTIDRTRLTQLAATYRRQAAAWRAKARRRTDPGRAENAGMEADRWVALADLAESAARGDITADPALSAAAELLADLLEVAQ